LVGCAHKIHTQLKTHLEESAKNKRFFCGKAIASTEKIGLFKNLGKRKRRDFL